MWGIGEGNGDTGDYIITFTLFSLVEAPGGAGEPSTNSAELGISEKKSWDLQKSLRILKQNKQEML